MHQALQSTEIFEIVCSFAAQTSLAWTCRTFEGPSLNALWHEPDPADCALTGLLPDAISDQVYGDTVSRLFGPFPTACQ